MLTSSDEYRPTIDIPPKMLDLNDGQMSKLVTAMCGYNWDAIVKLLGPEKSQKLKAENAKGLAISDLAGICHVSAHEVFLAGMYGEMGQKVQAHVLTGEIRQRLPEGRIIVDESELEVLAELASGVVYGKIRPRKTVSLLTKKLRAETNESTKKKIGWMVVFHAWLKGLMTDEMLAEASVEVAEAASEKSRRKSDAAFLRRSNEQGGARLYQPDENELGLLLTEKQLAALKEVQSKWKDKDFNKRGRKPRQRARPYYEFDNEAIEDIRREHEKTYE